MNLYCIPYLMPVRATVCAHLLGCAFHKEVLTEAPRVKRRFTRRVPYSTVTLLARLRGWSTSHPRMRATSRASSCSGTVAVMALKASRTDGM